MKQAFHQFLQLLFTQKRLANDHICLKQVICADNTTEYIAYNKLYEKYENKDAYPIALRLLFEKPQEHDEVTLSGIENNFRKQIVKNEDMIFIGRKDKNNTREVLFYISNKSLVSINSYAILSAKNNSGGVEIIIRFDKEWIIAQEYLGKKTNATSNYCYEPVT